jgi:acetyltransferase-like isoleucine patch superfamily enzyme
MIKKIKTILKKLLEKRNYICDKKTVIYKCAQIYNNLSNPNLIKIGAYTHIKGELLTFGHGGKIEIGEYCFIGKNTYIWSAKSIKIGNRVLISHNCNIFDNDTHPLNPADRHKQYKEIINRGHPKKINLLEKAIILEDDVLVGANSIILKGVTIGEGAIVGAGSVVTKDVLPYTMVAGNPARVIKKIKYDKR